MDTSETVEIVKWYEDPVYIKMCDCEEIQKLLDKKEGGNYLYRKFISNRPSAPMRAYTCVDITNFPSLYWLEEYGNHEPAQQWVSNYDSSNHPDYYGTDVIWLPRQDQLQILSGLTWVEFDDKCREYWFIDGRRETTKEQAGICAVMDTKFNKRWVCNEWILDKTTQ